MVRHGGKTSQRKLGTDEGAFTRTRKPLERTDASITTITNERIGQFIQKVSISYIVKVEFFKSQIFVDRCQTDLNFSAKMTLDFLLKLTFLPV